jgi:Tol biopolymer transport system component
VLPTWSPDGKQIAFVSDRDGNDEIYVMNVDGSNVKRLTNNPEQDLFPSWSPDGEWIVFSTTRDVDAEIYKMNKNGGSLIRLTDDPAADSNPAWSPDNTRIAFISRRDGFANLFVMGTDGANPTQLTFYKSIVEVPSWSSDSRMIAFASDMEGTRDIFIIGADGAGLDRLTDSPSEDFYPAWAHDQTTLASALPEPTAAPGDVCVNASDASYGFTPENPVRIGYDPRLEGIDERQCLPWLLGPQGQSVSTKLLDEENQGIGKLCKVEITYEGQAEPDVMYFDVNTFEQPKAPVGYSCGSPVAYLKAITAARYQ